MGSLDGLERRDSSFTAGIAAHLEFCGDPIATPGVRGCAGQDLIKCWRLLAAAGLQAGPEVDAARPRWAGCGPRMESRTTRTGRAGRGRMDLLPNSRASAAELAICEVRHLLGTAVLDRQAVRSIRVV